MKGQIAEVLELVLTTFNRELYEQGLKEDATKEANEKITKLQQQLIESDKQNKEKEKQLEDKDKQIAELTARIAELTNK